jgi:hypothetical protein
MREARPQLADERGGQRRVQRFERDFSQLSVHQRAKQAVQPKLFIGATADRFSKRRMQWLSMSCACRMSSHVDTMARLGTGPLRVELNPSGASRQPISIDEGS